MKSVALPMLDAHMFILHMHGVYCCCNPGNSAEAFIVICKIINVNKLFEFTTFTDKIELHFKCMFVQLKLFLFLLESFQIIKL